VPELQGVWFHASTRTEAFMQPFPQTPLSAKRPRSRIGHIQPKTSVKATTIPTPCREPINIAPSFPESLSDNLFKLFRDLFFCGIEIENVIGSAVGTRIPLRITINENNIKCLCALVAVECLFYGKNPFHLVAFLRIGEGFIGGTLSVQ
jgi:hypothetical protein